MKHVVKSGLWLAVACAMGFGYLAVTADQANAQVRPRGDPKPLVTWEQAPGDYEALSWSATPVPVDTQAVASPLRTDIAADIFAGLLSDPSWRFQYDALFQTYKSWNYEPDVAMAMANAMAASKAVSLADALIEAAGG